MKNYLGIKTKTFKFTHQLVIEDNQIGTFCQELVDVLNPCGTFKMAVGTAIYPMVEIIVPEDYGVQLETFLDKWFGKGTSEEWRSKVLDAEDEDDE